VRAALLALLAEEPRHGYQLIQELSERTNGLWQPSPGSVYPTLQQLEDEGLVRAEEADGRRVFHLTDAGRAEAAARTGPTPWDNVVNDDNAVDLRALIAQVAAAAVQVGHVGNDAQVAQAETVLTDARRSLYRLLAQDDSEA
jgi:DNA-binding PadR family transcriptional regulator